MDFLKDVVVWISGQTGLTENVVGWIMGAMVPIFSAIAMKLDFAGKEKLIDDLFSGWKKSAYVFIYGKAQWANDQILKVPGLGWFWENILEPFFLKMISGAIRLVVRFLLGLANLVAEIPLAISAGFNSRGENLVEKKK